MSVRVSLCVAACLLATALGFSEFREPSLGLGLRLDQRRHLSGQPGHLFGQGQQIIREHESAECGSPFWVLLQKASNVVKVFDVLDRGCCHGCSSPFKLSHTIS